MTIRLLSLFVILGIGVPSEEPINQNQKLNMYEVLSSAQWTWIDQSCDNYLMNFSFDLDKNKMYLQTETRVEGQAEKQVSTFEYDILSRQKRRMHTKIVNERRVDKDGIPVAWDLVLPNDSVFYWVRSDWQRGSRTKLNVKCPISL